MDGYLNNLQALLGGPPPLAAPITLKSSTSSSSSSSLPQRSKTITSPGSSTWPSAHPPPLPITTSDPTTTTTTLHHQQYLQSIRQDPSAPPPQRIASRPRANTFKTAKDVEMMSRSIQAKAQNVGPLPPPSLGGNASDGRPGPTDLLDVLVSASSMDLFKKNGRSKSRGGALLSSSGSNMNSHQPSSTTTTTTTPLSLTERPPRMQRSTSAHALQNGGLVTAREEFSAHLLSTRDFMASVLSSLDSVAAAAGSDPSDSSLKPEPEPSKPTPPPPRHSPDQSSASSDHSQPLTPPMTPLSPQRSGDLFNDVNGSPARKMSDSLGAVVEDVHKKLADMVRHHRERRGSDAPPAMKSDTPPATKSDAPPATKSPATSMHPANQGVSPDDKVAERIDSLNDIPDTLQHQRPSIPIHDLSPRHPRERSVSSPSDTTSRFTDPPHRSQPFNLPPPPPRLQSANTSSSAPIATFAEPEKLDRIIAAMMKYPALPLTSTRPVMPLVLSIAMPLVPSKVMPLVLFKAMPRAPSKVMPLLFTRPPPLFHPIPPKATPQVSTCPLVPSPPPLRSKSVTTTTTTPHIHIPPFTSTPPHLHALSPPTAASQASQASLIERATGLAVVTGVMPDDVILEALKHIHVGHVERLPPRKASLSSRKVAEVGVDGRRRCRLEVAEVGVDGM
ncbi:hypothetical protein BC829DRAFT_486891 [Chytridium lagenaria]|nr:hypothetical protein BC829DRAFT_486891 [Chytridium lagenaria]